MFSSGHSGKPDKGQHELDLHLGRPTAKKALRQDHSNSFGPDASSRPTFLFVAGAGVGAGACAGAGVGLGLVAGAGGSGPVNSSP